jgi:type I restriction enzyme S subunit
MDWSETGYLALSALNVKNGYIDFMTDANFGGEELYQKWMTGNELRKGQILFTTEAPMGNVAQIPDDRKYILSQRTIAFDLKEEIVTDDFMATLLKTDIVFNALTALSSGGTAKGVSQKSMEQLVIVVPHNIQEQTAIGDFFRNLDTLIESQREELEKLQNIKSACLNKMFV